jgi:DNA replication and repair protein RecF
MAENRARDSVLDPWDIELVAGAREIVLARREYLDLLAQHFRSIVDRIGYHVTGITMTYEPAGLFETSDDDQENLRVLRRLRPREIRFGASLAGPHRDRLTFTLDGRDAAEVLSSGELKMVVLFLKLAKIELVRAERGESPLFVFDDVDAELDLPIIEKLLRSVGPAQLFASSAKGSIFSMLQLREHRLFSVAHGIVKTVEEAGL